jgi:hypothetical protein
MQETGRVLFGKCFKHKFMRALHYSLAFCLLLSAVDIKADSQDFDKYTVHYIAVNSTFLTPKIAQQYHIVRSQRRAFLNIAVLRNNPNGSTTPVTATLSGGKTNLLQQTGSIEFEQIQEGESIYYIGQFDFSNAEIVRFTVQVQPEQKGPDYNVQWSTQLYSN